MMVMTATAAVNNLYVSHFGGPYYRVVTRKFRNGTVEPNLLLKNSREDERSLLLSLIL